MRTGIFVNDSLPPEAREVLAEYDVFEGTADDRTLSLCQVLMAWPGRAKKELLLKMPSMRMFQALSAGVDGLDMPSLPQGVAVFSNAGAYSGPVGEHAWGLLLGAAKGIHLRNQKLTPRRLRGGTLIVVGCGGIGSEVARLSKSLEMKAVGVSRSFTAPELYESRHGVEELPDLMGSADAIIIALPSTNLTKGLFDYALLSKAKSSVVVVNVGRGETVDEDGLVRWLKERPDSRYATDVFWTRGGRETFATDAWQLPNFAGTLHISGLPAGETLSGPKLAAAKNVRAFLTTGRARNEVDLSEYLSPKT